MPQHCINEVLEKELMSIAVETVQVQIIYAFVNYACSTIWWIADCHSNWYDRIEFGARGWTKINQFRLICLRGTRKKCQWSKPGTSLVQTTFTEFVGHQWPRKYLINHIWVRLFLFFWDCRVRYRVLFRCGCECQRVNVWCNFDVCFSCGNVFFPRLLLLLFASIPGIPPVFLALSLLYFFPRLLCTCS